MSSKAFFSNDLVANSIKANESEIRCKKVLTVKRTNAMGKNFESDVIQLMVGQKNLTPWGKTDETVFASRKKAAAVV